MKDKDLFKIPFKNLISIPIGVFLLLISYVLLYFVAGNDVFQNEINDLKNIHIFIKQLTTSGLIFYTITLYINYGKNFLINMKSFKSIDFMLQFIYLCIIFIILFLLKNLGCYSENIIAIYSLILIFILLVEIITYLFISTFDSKKINKKIKDIQNQRLD